MLISHYNLRRYRYERLHTQGKTQDFIRPCIGYILAGEATFLYRGKQLIARAGDVIYIAADTRYYSVWRGEPEIDWYSIDFAFEQKDAFYEYPFQILRGFPPDLFHEIFDSSPLRSLSCFYRLLEELYGQMEQVKRAPKSLIDPAVHYIEEHFTEKLSAGELAALCRCSESSLFKQFHRVMRISPIAYKQNLQIQQAQDLLNRTDDSIEEISRKVGFCSSNYFRTVFLKLVGQSPKEFRKSVRAE